MNTSLTARVFATLWLAVPCAAAAQDGAGSANQSPSITGSPSASILQGEFFGFAPSASDADGDPLTFWVQNKPGWADFHSPSGTLHGAPAAEDVGLYENIRIWVTDGEAWAAMPAFDIDVFSSDLPWVRLSWDPPTTNVDGSLLSVLSGYRIHIFALGSTTQQTVEVTDPQLTSYLLGNLSPGLLYFTITGISSAGIESDYSDLAVHDAQ